MTERTGLATAKQLAEYLGLDTQTLANWRWKRQGPPWVKLAGTIRYEWPEIEKWVAEQTHRPGQ